MKEALGSFGRAVGDRISAVTSAFTPPDNAKLFPGRDDVDERAAIGWRTVAVIVFVLAIVSLAAWASGGDVTPQVNQAVGLSVVAALGVSLLALAFWPSLATGFPKTNQSLKAFGAAVFWIATPVLVVDFVLRWFFAPIFGILFRHSGVRYAILSLHMALAVGVLFVLPEFGPSWRPYAALGLLWGLIGILSVVRRWRWNERRFELQGDGGGADDDPTDDDTEDLHDLRGEALFALLIFFAAIPLAMRETHQVLPDAFLLQHGLTPLIVDWYALFGAELLKALPIVDWAEIYDVGTQTRLVASPGLGQHAIFLMRVLVDLVLLGAVFGAIDRIGRVARHESELKAGRRRLVDPAAERQVLRAIVAGWHEKLTSEKTGNAPGGERIGSEVRNGTGNNSGADEKDEWNSLFVMDELPDLKGYQGLVDYDPGRLKRMAETEHTHHYDSGIDARYRPYVKYWVRSLAFHLAVHPARKKQRPDMIAGVIIQLQSETGQSNSANPLWELQRLGERLLSMLGQEGLEKLVDNYKSLLPKTDPRSRMRRQAVVAALGRIGAPAVPLLTEIAIPEDSNALWEPHRAVRTEAIRALGEIDTTEAREALAQVNKRVNLTGDETKELKRIARAKA